jgi:hypothetical protein
MKIHLCLVFSTLVVLNLPAVIAAPAVPSLVGTWSTKSEGAFMAHGKSAGEFTHWTKGQKTLVGEVRITSQEGRVIRGVFTSKKTEPFVGVIGMDKKLYLADQDGTLDGRIVNKNTIEIIYRHVSAKDTVVAVGVWTRKK